MVIGLNYKPGDEINANEAILTISDRNTVTITANVDERNIGYLKPGMPVNLDQWGTQAFGFIENVSLSSTVNNGVATYPVIISADNYDGTLQLNSYINFTIEASRAENCLTVPVQCVNNVLLADEETEATVVYLKADEEPENVAKLSEMAIGNVPEGFYPVIVEIGLSDSFKAQVLSGLEEGMEVYTQTVTTEVWN